MNTSTSQPTSQQTYRVETVVVLINHVRASSQEDAERQAGKFDIRQLWQQMRGYVFSRYKVLPSTAPETAWWRA